MMDFTYIGPAFAKLVIKLCAFSEEIVLAAMTVFNKTKYASATLTPEANLLATANISLSIFQNQIPSSLRQILQLFRDNTNGNQLVTASFTNTRCSRNSQDNVTFSYADTFSFYSKCSFDPTCNCGMSSTSCAMSYLRYFEIFGNPFKSFPIVLNQTIDGLFLACNPLENFLYSTLECLYNTICVMLISIAFQYGEFTLGGSFQPPNITAIQYTPLSIFKPNTTIIDIINALMIERWISEISFDRYFAQCHPTLCVYRFTQRFDFVNTIVTVIGLAGGWSVVLRILTPLLMAVVRRKKSKQTPVMQFIEAPPGKNTIH